MLLSVLYDWGGFNRDLFSVINSCRGPIIDVLALAGTQLGDVTNAAWIMLAMGLLTILHRVLPRHLAPAWFPEERVVSEILFVFAVGCAVTALLVFAGKASFDMPRPYDALPSGSVNVLAKAKEPYSLPSGHAALAMLIAWVFWPYCRNHWKLLLAACVVWVGVSRVSVGAHFPADVLAGYICGGASGWLATRALALRARKSRCRAEPPDPDS